MRRNKFGAVPTVVDGVRFASKKEARRYVELKLLQKAGEIGRLELQPKFPIVVNGMKICAYIADFRYWCHGRPVVEDAKGVKTPVYRLKKKIVEAQYGIAIREV